MLRVELLDGGLVRLRLHVQVHQHGLEAPRFEELADDVHVIVVGVVVAEDGHSSLEVWGGEVWDASPCAAGHERLELGVKHVDDAEQGKGFARLGFVDAARHVVDDVREEDLERRPVDVRIDADLGMPVGVLCEQAMISGGGSDAGERQSSAPRWRL